MNKLNIYVYHVLVSFILLTFITRIPIKYKRWRCWSVGSSTMALCTAILVWCTF